MTTNEYYETNADHYAKRFAGADMSSLYALFLEHLPARARILDAGCGPGRDACAFAEMGHAVTAFDASAAMIDVARQQFDGPLHNLRFDEVAWQAEFDGIWAMASLLHVPRDDLSATLVQLSRALVPGGTMFMSFKKGTGDRVKDGRLYTDFEEAPLKIFVNDVESLNVKRVWWSEDILSPDRQSWVNCMCARGA